MNKPDTWTEVDEERFAAMQERRERVITARRSALVTALGRMWPASEPRFGPLGLKAIIDNAGEIRDALAPYDNGVRVPETSNG